MAAASRVARAVLLCLAVFPAFADGLSLDPLGPVAGQPVTLRVPTVCGHRGHTVTRDANSVHVVVLPQTGSCPSPPIAFPYLVPLGTFTTGEYSVDVKDTFDVTIGTTTFVVRNAERNPDYGIHPWAVPTTPGDLQLTLTLGDSSDLCGGNCDATSIVVDGTTIPFSQLEEGLRFQAPEHARGLVDVRIVNPKATTVLPGAIYYYEDDTRRFDPSVFERLLFPVLFQTGGVGGSQWHSEAVISNPTRWFIQMLNTVQPFVCLGFPCGQRIGPREQQKFDGSGYPHGIALLAGRDDADDLSLRLRIRDTSRQTQSFGTEIPVVREKDMFRGTWIPILDVPADANFRVKLRVYAFPDRLYGDRNIGGATIVRVQPGTTNFTRTAIGLEAPCSGGVCAAQTPLYGEIDFASGAANERTDVYVQLSDGAIGWAFASITNNTTQEVTIATPNGRGGSPCDLCY